MNALIIEILVLIILTLAWLLVTPAPPTEGDK